MFKFEFDENKSKANLKKHGVSFEEAISCFNDSQSIEFYDEAHSTDEDRFILLGNSNQGRVLMVAYTIRDNMKVISSIRIISARPATKQELQTYAY